MQSGGLDDSGQFHAADIEVVSAARGYMGSFFGWDLPRLCCADFWDRPMSFSCSDCNLSSFVASFHYFFFFFFFWLDVSLETRQRAARLSLHGNTCRQEIEQLIFSAESLQWSHFKIKSPHLHMHAHLNMQC